MAVRQDLKGPECGALTFWPLVLFICDADRLSRKREREKKRKKEKENVPLLHFKEVLAFAKVPE